MSDPDVLSLHDLHEALADAAGLLDQVVEHLVHHRHAENDTVRMAELYSIEGFTAQGWAFARTAHTRLTEYLATRAAQTYECSPVCDDPPGTHDHTPEAYRA